MAAPNPWKTRPAKVVEEKSKLLDRLYIEYKADPKPNEKTKKGEYTKDAINAAMRDRARALPEPVPPLSGKLGYPPRVLCLSETGGGFIGIIRPNLPVYISPLPVDSAQIGEGSTVWNSGSDSAIIANIKPGDDNKKAFISVLEVTISTGAVTDISDVWWAQGGRSDAEGITLTQGIAVRADGWIIRIGPIKARTHDKTIDLWPQFKQKFLHDIEDPRREFSLSLYRGNCITKNNILFSYDFDGSNEVVFGFDSETHQLWQHSLRYCNPGLVLEDKNINYSGHVLLSSDAREEEEVIDHEATLILRRTTSPPELWPLPFHVIGIIHGVSYAVASLGYISHVSSLRSDPVTIFVRKHNGAPIDKQTLPFPSVHSDITCHFMPPSKDEIKQMSRWLSQQIGHEVFPTVIWQAIAEWLTDV
jgi:hypothetical protein